MIFGCLGETVLPMDSILGCKLAIGMSRPYGISDRAEEMHSARVCSLSSNSALLDEHEDTESAPQ